MMVETAERGGKTIALCRIPQEDELITAVMEEIKNAGYIVQWRGYFKRTQDWKVCW